MGRTPLLCTQGNKEVVGMLLGHGADISATDTDGRTALLCAIDELKDSYGHASQERLDGILVLIEMGSGVNEIDNRR